MPQNVIYLFILLWSRTHSTHNDNNKN